MSAIQSAIKDATDIAPKRGEDRQDYLARALKAIAEMDDAGWDGLPQDVQDWFNSAADAKNSKAKTLPDFPDAEQADEVVEEKTTRRRASKDDEEEDKPTKSKAPGAVDIDPAKLKKGMVVKIVTKRGKNVDGTVVEIDDEIVVVKMGNGDEEEVSIDRIDVCQTLEPASKGKASKADDEEVDPIKVGASVVVTTKRGKEIAGKIVEMDDEVIVLKTDDGEEELDRGRVESIKVAGGAKAEEKTSRRSSKSDDKADDKGDGKAKRSTNEGVSVGTRIKELIAEDLEATAEDIAAKLKKEGLEFRENTLKLNYTDAHKFIDILKKAKLLK